MSKLGLAFKQIVAKMADDYNKEKPYIFTKLDKDGFWRMAVNDMDSRNFCYVLPSNPKPASLDNIQLVVPNSLQISWCESPLLLHRL